MFLLGYTEKNIRFYFEKLDVSYIRRLSRFWAGSRSRSTRAHLCSFTLAATAVARTHTRALLLNRTLPCAAADAATVPPPPASACAAMRESCRSNAESLRMGAYPQRTGFGCGPRGHTNERSEGRQRALDGLARRAAGSHRSKAYASARLPSTTGTTVRVTWHDCYVAATAP